MTDRTMTPEEREFDRCMSAMPGRPSARQLLYQTHYRVVTAAVKAAEVRDDCGRHGACRVAHAGEEKGPLNCPLCTAIRRGDDWAREAQELSGEVRQVEERMREQCAMIAKARADSHLLTKPHLASEAHRIEDAIRRVPLTGDSDDNKG